MSPSLGNTEEGLSNVSLVVSSASSDSTNQSSLGLKERNYMGFSEASSAESSVISCSLEEKENSLNLKETELRLGLPGSQSPKRDSELCRLSQNKLDEKHLFPLAPLKDGSAEEKYNRNSVLSTIQKTVVSGSKRGFSDAMDGFSQVKNTIFSEGNWMFTTAGSESETAQSAQGKFLTSPGVNSAAVKQGHAAWHTGGLEHPPSAILSSRPSGNSGAKAITLKDHTGASSTILKEIVPPKMTQEKSRGPSDPNHNQISPANNHGNAPASKAQVVGWPPIRSFRKNTLAASSKNNEEVDGKPGSGALFVKVSMDGAPYLRKVDLKIYSTYPELSSALEKMFSCFTIGQCGSHGVPGRDMLSESKLKDLLHGSEFVLTYEDKDGDWMLVGDVPWVMFIDSCRRLRIMKSSDAIGLAPRAMEKCRNRN